jgi:hypothetical protein
MNVTAGFFFKETNMKSLIRKAVVIGMVVLALAGVAALAQPMLAQATPAIGMHPQIVQAVAPIQQDAPNDLDSQALAGIAGIVLSLVLSYAPKFGAWFNAQESGTKVEITGALLLIVGVAIYGLGCAGWAPDFGLAVSCDRPGLVSLFNALVSALIANQAAYLAFVKPFASTNPA